jgi:16S rRNA (cytosine1402-N4)-methyltransferase
MVGLPEHGHEPVMVEEVLRLLGLEDKDPGRADAMGPSGVSEDREGKPIYMDCTVGRGGHAVRMAQALAKTRAGGAMLVALDVDPDNLKYARRRIAESLGRNVSLEGDGEEHPVSSGEAGGSNVDEPAARPVQAIGGGVELRTFHANFGEAGDVLDALGVPPGVGLSGLLADFGVSTNQLLEPRHGLSFNAELPLDMRLDPRIKERAADIVAHWDEKDLATILHEYAQERYAWRIARKIVQTRASEPILTTGQLARLVRSVVPPARHKAGQIDPATRTFQALRMAVNSELERIEDLLDAVPALMQAGGRAVFISFHSGEDRLIKNAVRAWEEAGIAAALTKKPLEPGDEEMSRNPRSRSAKVRAVVWKVPPSSPNVPPGRDARPAGRRS